MDTRRHAPAVHGRPDSGLCSVTVTEAAGGLGETEAEVVVPVVGRVPVAVRRTHVCGIVVPGTAPVHTLAAIRSAPWVKTTSRKIDRRRPSVSACCA